MFTVSDEAIKESEILAVSLPRDMAVYTSLPDQSSFAVHIVCYTSKDALAIDYNC